MFKSVAAALFSLALLAPVARADAPAKIHYLTLQGHGQVTAKPDMAVVEMGAVSQAPTAKAALEANTKAVTALIAMLKESGVEDKDIQTSGFSVGPRYAGTNSNNTPRIIGYEVNNGVTARIPVPGQV